MPVVRTLTGADTPAVVDLLSHDPYHHVSLEHRLTKTSLDSPWFGGHIYGFFADGQLIAGCDVGSNVLPFGAYNDEIAQAWISVLRSRPRTSLIGRSDIVTDLWSRLTVFWGSARSARLNQPLLAIDSPPDVAPDPKVRRVLLDEFDLIYPSFIAMFTEEVGVHPESGGKEAYRARVASLITQGWSFARIDQGQVIFKAEVGAATSHAAQLQGVFVAPEFRGQNLSAPAMATVVNCVRESIAPMVTLSVNDYNIRALRLYQTVGFKQIGTLASVHM